MVTHVRDHDFLMLRIKEDAGRKLESGFGTFDYANWSRVTAGIRRKYKNRIANVICHEKLAVFFIEVHLRRPVQLSGRATDDTQRSNVANGVERINSNGRRLEFPTTRKHEFSALVLVRNVPASILGRIASEVLAVLAEGDRTVVRDVHQFIFGVD